MLINDNEIIEIDNIEKTLYRACLKEEIIKASLYIYRALYLRNASKRSRNINYGKIFI